MAPASAIPARGPRLNLVEQVFTVPERNRLWVGDITYIPTGEGRLYLATVIGAWSRKVVWWSMSNRITEDLAIDAINQAVGRENPGGGLVFRDDRGPSTRHGHTNDASRSTG